MSVSSIGPLVSRYQVEQAVIATLRTWLETYLAEVERQHALPTQTLDRPPSAEAFYGSLDGLSGELENFPALLVEAQPDGDAEFRGSGDYDQWFEVQVHALLTGQDELAAMKAADLYGAAVKGAIIQNQDLGGVAVRSRMTSEPRTEFIDPSERRVARSVFPFRVLVCGTVNQYQGPASPGTPPVVGVAENVTITVTEFPADAPIPD